MPRLIFINKECGNLAVFVDGGNLTRNVSKKSQTFSKVIDVHAVTDNIGKIASSTSIRIIVNQLDKHDFSCGRFFFWIGSK